MKLLVSVRNLDEARMALDAGADIVDLKEPARGSLGAVPYADASHVGDQMGQWATLSIAMGELIGFDHLSLFDLKLLSHFSFAKIGLAGCRSIPDWQSRWREWAERISRCSSPVAVSYADHNVCQAPDINEVAEIAIQSSAKTFLIDTFRKDGGNLFSHHSVAELNRFLRPLRTHAISIAVAGSVSAENHEQIVSINPDIVAVRSAICENGNREAAVCPQRIAEFAALLKSPLRRQNAKI